jgi:hypothetical protein
MSQLLTEKRLRSRCVERRHRWRLTLLLRRYQAAAWPLRQKARALIERARRAQKASRS